MLIEKVKSKKKIRFIFFFLTIFTFKGLEAQDFKLISKENGLSSNNVRKVVQDNFGRLWIATSIGLNCYDGSRLTKYYHNALNEHSLIDNNITDISCSKNGDIYIGTLNGLSIYSNSGDIFLNYKIVDSNDSPEYPNKISCVKEGCDGKIWVGGTSGLYIFDVEEKSFEEKFVYGFFFHLSFEDIEVLKTQEVPVSVIDKLKLLRAHFFKDEKHFKKELLLILGKVAYNNYSSKILSYLFSKQNIISSSAISTFIFDNEGVWLGFENGCVVYTSMEKDFYSVIYIPKKHHFGTRINSLLVFDKKLWMGTDTGAKVIDLKSWQHFDFYDKGVEAALGSKIRSFTVAKERDIWISASEGLYKLSKDKDGRYQNLVNNQIVSRLEPDNISNVYFDNRYNIWVSTTDEGLYQVMKPEYFDDKPGKTWATENENTFNEKVELLKSKSPIGNEIHYEPGLIFTDFKLHKRSIKVGDAPVLKQNINITKKIELKHYQNSFSLSFTVVDFVEKESISYSYKLVGVDRNWNFVQDINKVSYNDLEPGEYKFIVKTRNDYKNWSEKELAVDIIVKAPFWKSHILYSVYLFSAALCWFLINYLVKSFKKRKANFSFREKGSGEKNDVQEGNFIFQKGIGKDLPYLLIVDETEIARKNISMELGGLFNVLISENRAQALERIQDNLPDLIIYDIKSLDSEGFEFCGVLKSNIDTCHIPIVLIASQNDDFIEMKGFENGADAIMFKPFKFSVLKSRLKNLYNKNVRIKDQLKSLNAPPVEREQSDEEIFILKVNDIVLSNLSDMGFSIEMLCSEIGISRSALYSRIKSLTGMSLSEYIKHVRLQKSLEFFKLGKRSVSDVAYSVGFKTLAHFSRCFSKEFGIAPSEYIAKVRLKEKTKCTISETLREKV